VDDAIVVIENIARHWAMRDGRPRLQATIEAVAEVGNPTIVATLTVVAALLPMLFVSGMMGPYMSPIPANASAAMIFSFFVAVMVTPWLMLKVAGKTPVHVQANGHGGGMLGRAYSAVARPILSSKAASWTFLLVVGVLTLGSLSLFYTKDVTVKLLPFDNKSEFQVVVDMPAGTPLEATAAVLREALARLEADGPDARDGLNRLERCILLTLHELEAERGGDEGQHGRCREAGALEVVAPILVQPHDDGVARRGRVPPDASDVVRHCHRRRYPAYIIFSDHRSMSSWHKVRYVHTSDR